MTTFLVCIGILGWISLILVGIFQDAEEVQKETSKEVLEKSEEPEVYLESISDEQLFDMFGSVRKKNNKFVSISSTKRYFSMSLSDSTSRKIYEALSPIPYLDRDLPHWSNYDASLRSRPISDSYVTVQITYFDSNFVFNTQRIQLKRIDVGYVCESKESDEALKELKRFFENSYPISKKDIETFTAKAEELDRQERDFKVKQTVEEVFSRHISYNKTAVLYGTEKAVPITSVDTFYNFCELVGYHIPSQLKAEITNYLYILFGVNNDN